jgi:redox-sensitive bicupin YhaK (pirin superfamily)
MLDLVIEARAASLGAGMDVKRILPFRLRRMVGPFIFMDHGGPVKADPKQFSNMDVLPHPHIGLSTVSYCLADKLPIAIVWVYSKL